MTRAVASFFVLFASLFSGCGGTEATATTTPDTVETQVNGVNEIAEPDVRPKLGHGCIAEHIDAFVSSTELALRLRCACGDVSACEEAGNYVCLLLGQSVSDEGACDVGGVMMSNEFEPTECLPDSHLRGPAETYRQCVCGVEAACLALEETVQLHRYLGLDPGMPEPDWFAAHEAGVLAIFE